jgi:hypothetical protein
MPLLRHGNAIPRGELPPVHAHGAFRNLDPRVTTVAQRKVALLPGVEDARIVARVGVDAPSST